MEFTTASGEILKGECIRMYPAFEGGMRYIIQTQNGKEYRCVMDDKGKYVEYVA